MDTLLVIEDDPGIQKQLKWCFPQYEVVMAADRKSAITALRRYEPKVITLDLGLPPDEANASEGLIILQEMLALAPDTKIIVITGNDDKANALKAIELGAHDFYHKPIDDDILAVIIDRAFVVAKLESENINLRQSSLEANGFIGNSPQIQQVCRMIERIAPTEITTLILGESGTGKEVIARAIHTKGPRADKPFIAINCASIPEHLLESELFGFEKGAFTGAHKTTAGKIECADGGTLFLDEIGDMPYPLQAKILRFLQEKVIERVGGRQEIPVDVKIICATHQNLEQMMTDKTFREDLFYRISEITIQNPPLRDRDQDILILARYFLQQANQQSPRKISGFTDDAIRAMLQHNWPGNIRELQNKVKSAVIMSDNKFISSLDLALQPTEDDLEPMALNLRQVREAAEKQAIAKALSLSNGNMSNTANILGITRPTLYSLMDKYTVKNG
ncbi:PEP-CTERM-box response regulator transcription factor [Photobacterium sp. WH77]|uniref:PEP-CTERM-box response regulator transcription factor n=1 Tax=Photobacterium arenosum TaxID=2774143 RepID=A0ABR9BRV0_9GAMM|nr:MULTISPECIES: PEP-CTERM-box response regulator transcription factor [Photobacterium]MBD8514221.1 PEP-CTERM-box response regulator transcription factor [Photobacterium arenosum]MCG2837216.1 PEP-CTERM-box response regulator transcription factor [Photobacterium sp. WH77]MCG2844832.1 PEP-CTERM-box response regulator transcription factor [Photobacterium sp. WH80]MDO6581426.1 PEP-CTERM-box response regulator transcription factor [Photobacterium sp. 2_MG-2023]